jgi:hypothetical protein
MMRVGVKRWVGVPKGCTESRASVTGGMDKKERL